MKCVFGIQTAAARAIAALAVIALAEPVSAQEPALTDREIAALLPGKVLTYRSDKRPVGPAESPTQWVPRVDGSHSVVEFSFRSDKSVKVRCAYVARSGERSNCAGMAGSDVGLWSVEAGGLCITWLNWGSSVPRCYRLLREGDGFRARQISGGSSSMDGALVTLKQMN